MSESFSSLFFTTNQDNQDYKSPNYYPIMDQTISSPRLSSHVTQIPNHMPEETPRSTGTGEDWSPDRSPEEESESPIRIVRSMVSAFLLKRSEEHEQFVPTSSDMIMDLLEFHRLIAPFEKRALLEVGQDNDEDEYDVYISAINSALLSIEADTGAINCYQINKHVNGVVKRRVGVMSIQADQLGKELLPFQLHLEDLCLSGDEPNREDEHETEMERLRALLDN